MADSNKKEQQQRNSGTNATNISHIRYCDISDIKNEIIDLENSSEIGEGTIKQDPDLDNGENTTEEDDPYWDNSIADILEVECNEDFPNEMSMQYDNFTNFKQKIYPIESICAICYKEFSCQREFGKHAQEEHPGEKAFKCQHCPVLFSKFKSVTAHFNRGHADKEKNNHIQVESHHGYTFHNDFNEEDIFSNRKGKIYPIENNCAICEKPFSTQKDLVQHAREDHPDAKVFKCLYCPTLFSKLKSVTTHYKRSHSQLRKTFICEYCNMTFFTHFLLDRHRRSHTEQRPFVCRACDKTYKYKRNLLVHIKTHSKNGDSSNNQMEDDFMDEYSQNDDQNLFAEDEYCENDEQNSINRDGYCEMDEQNLLSESDDEPIFVSELAAGEDSLNNVMKHYQFRCNECQKHFKCKENLKIHQKTHAKNNEFIETINLDDVTTNENFNYYNSTYFIIDELNTDSEHYGELGEESFAAGNYSEGYAYEDYALADSQNTEDITQNECAICLKVFKCQQAVAKHLQRCHAEVEFFKCPYCDDNLYSRETLSQHIIMKNHPQKRNVCEMCLKSFDRRSDLRRHLRIHTDERPYSCNICNKTFKQTNHLKRHKEISHDGVTNELKFACQLCPRSFLLKETLGRHMSTHGKGTNYPCPMCHKSFKTRYDWQRHQETHSSRKYLTCDFCLKSFNDKDTFNSHIDSHTGDRKYLCTICNKDYREKSHLVNHRKSHTNC